MLVPVTWKDGWPVYGDDGRLPEKIDIVSTRPGYEYAPLFVSDRFDSPEIKPQWQWNHVPDCGRWSILPEGGLAITTGAVCANLTQARNTLTQRMRFPDCEAEVTVDASGLADGDFAGMCALQGAYMAVGILRENGRKLLVVIERKEPSKGFGIGGNDTEPGEITYREEIAGDVITVGIRADFWQMKDTAVAFVKRSKRDAVHGSGEAEIVGEPHKLYFRLDHFTGARFGLCAFSSVTPGGTAVFKEFVYR